MSDLSQSAREILKLRMRQKKLRNEADAVGCIAHEKQAVHNELTLTWADCVHGGIEEC